MKRGIIYGGAFLFVFVIVTGLIIYLNSSYENIFQLNFAPKSEVMRLGANNTDSLKITKNDVHISEPDSTIVQDSVLLSSLVEVEKNDSTHTKQKDENNINAQPENSNHIKENEIANTNDIKASLMTNEQSDTTPETQNGAQGKEYTEWVKKVTSIYSSMESRKAAKIIQTYSDNVARDILYSMNKKTAAKVVSELSPETANRIFRFE